MVSHHVEALWKLHTIRGNHSVITCIRKVDKIKTSSNFLLEEQRLNTANILKDC